MLPPKDVKGSTKWRICTKRKPDRTAISERICNQTKLQPGSETAVVQPQSDHCFAAKCTSYIVKTDPSRSIELITMKK